MFCRNCGCFVPDGSGFCPKCGSRVSDMFDDLEKAGFAEVRFKRFTFGLSTLYVAQKGGGL